MLVAIMQSVICSKKCTHFRVHNHCSLLIVTLSITLKLSTTPSLLTTDELSVNRVDASRKGALVNESTPFEKEEESYIYITSYSISVGNQAMETAWMM